MHTHRLNIVLTNDYYADTDLVLASVGISTAVGDREAMVLIRSVFDLMSAS
jgi:hypothetical protein